MPLTIKSWQKAKPIIRRDHMVSSVDRENGVVPFIPSYHNKGQTMWKLLDNTYMRIWFSERDKILKEEFARAEMVGLESHNKRRFVQKMFTHKNKIGKPLLNLPIQQQYDQGPTTRIVNWKTGGKEAGKKTQSKIEIPCIRYKPDCDNEASKGDGDKKRKIFKDDKYDKNDESKITNQRGNGLQAPPALVVKAMVCASLPMTPKPVRANGLACC